MCNYEEAKARAEENCWEGIRRGCLMCLREKGPLEALRFMRLLVDGKVLPAPVVLRIQEEAAKIAAAGS